MIFMLVLTVILLALVAATVWSAVTDTTPDEGAKVADTAAAPVTTVPETLEGVLARQLLDGEITGTQYRRAVHRLAQRDADRHPLTVPSED